MIAVNRRISIINREIRDNRIKPVYLVDVINRIAAARTAARTASVF